MLPGGRGVVVGGAGVVGTDVVVEGTVDEGNKLNVNCMTTFNSYMIENSLKWQIFP